LAEQVTFNDEVPGSNPGGGTPPASEEHMSAHLDVVAVTSLGWEDADARQLRRWRRGRWRHARGG
jgi:hypothetical protein